MKFITVNIKQMFTIGHYKYFKINHGNNIYDINKDNIIQFLSILNLNYGYIVTATIVLEIALN